MHIDLVHDLVCPWCRIGKRNLDLALAEWEGAPAEVAYHPFLLDPAIPLTDAPLFADYMAAKFGTSDLTPVFQRVKAAGAAVGLTFNFDRIPRATNTSRAHLLVAITPAAQQGAMVDALHLAYFEQGADIAEISTLAGLAATLGLDPAAVTTALDSADDLAQVTAAAREATQAGISGVPFFIFDHAVTASGAQPAATLLAGLRQAAAAPASVSAPAGG